MIECEGPQQVGEDRYKCPLYGWEITVKPENLPIHCGNLCKQKPQQPQVKPKSGCGCGQSGELREKIRKVLSR
jgi:hypothetical protein